MSVVLPDPIAEALARKLIAARRAIEAHYTDEAIRAILGAERFVADALDARPRNAATRRTMATHDGIFPFDVPAADAS